MAEWKEIELKPRATWRTESAPEGKCPNCGVDIFRSLIPCPEGKVGCLVAHYGYRCDDCGKVYNK